MLIGYARVSTHDQNLDLQKDALQAAGCEKVFVDELSGAVATRPGLQKAMDTLREGDVLVVWRLDRLGRSLWNLIELVGQLDEMRVGFRSIQANITSGFTALYRLSNERLPPESRLPTQIIGIRVDDITVPSLLLCIASH